MPDTDEVSRGEIYRLCLEIRADVKAQNGRVNALEKDVLRIKTLWSAIVIIVGVFADAIRHKLGLP